MKNTFVFIKGAGDLASGIALRLFHAGFALTMTDIAQPTAVRRSVAFSEAVRAGSSRVEDATAVLVQSETEARKVMAAGLIALFIDPVGAMARSLVPDALVDAIIAKQNTGTRINDAPVVIGVGPGFIAGRDCHAVIETKRGHSLGRVITSGGAFPNTGVPGDIGGYTAERLLRAPAVGVFTALVAIGDSVAAGDMVATVSGTPLYAEISGIVRGLLPSGLSVTQGMKAGDVDPRCERAHCFTVSDKALAVAGGVLEAILRFGGS
jgi:xanthine dehydrogenase accessory factor